MTKKTVKAAAKPVVAKRHKLNNGHRAKLLTFAVSKFVAAEQRAAEKAARYEVISLFVDFHATEVAPVVETLRKFGATKIVTGIRLPNHRVIVTGTKEITGPGGGPGGELVMRDTTSLLEPPVEIREWAFSSSAIADMTISLYPNYRDGYGGRSYRRDNFLELPAPLEMATGAAGGDASSFFVMDDDRTTSRYDADKKIEYYLPKAFYEAMDRFYVAGAARYQAELKLHSTIAKIIAGAVYFEDLFEIWPEAKELETTLFAPPEAQIAPNYALVALSNEDKALLCSNMKSRGVEAAACSIAA